jgi:ribosomal protein S18 acetylase RimI-like enzyme
MIRLAKFDDARTIAEVHVKSWQTAYRGLLPEEFLQSLSVDRREQQWKASIENPEQVVLVYELEEIIIAFCSFAPTRDDDLDKSKVAELGTIYALESVWSQGIGQQLWNKAVTQMRERGFSEVMLWVLKGNDRAIKFYERMGLVFDGKTKTETWQNGITLNELRYRMKL